MAELIWRGKRAPFIDSSEGSSRVLDLQTFAQYDPGHANQPQSHSSSPTLEHDERWRNKLILGDKSDVLPILLRTFAEQVQLIYIDPPFMTGRVFTAGTQVAYRDTWKNDKDIYIQWLYETFSLLYALLAPQGSLYIHLDWRASHYARILLDEVFQDAVPHGGGFRNEIIWHYQSGGRARNGYARKHDTILLYTKSKLACFHGERVGERRGSAKRNNMRKEVDEAGHVTWTIRSAGRLYRYSEDSYMTPSDVWSDIHHLHQRDPERTGYATQKPEALLKRIIAASSEEQDIVLDCFCGSGVTPIVAEKLGRRWLAIDKSDAAIETTRARLLAYPSTTPFNVYHIAP